MNKKVLMRVGGRCFYCGTNLLLEGTDRPDTSIATVDHIVPRRHGGGNNIENLVPSCRSCNASKGTKTPEEFRFWYFMELFKKYEGVRFSPEQYAFLTNLGFDIGFETEDFHGEFVEKRDAEFLELTRKRQILKAKLATQKNHA